MLKAFTQVKKYKNSHDDSTDASPHTSRKTNSKGEL
jgi:hypothetical protein